MCHRPELKMKCPVNPPDEIFRQTFSDQAPFCFRLLYSSLLFYYEIPIISAKHS